METGKKFGVLTWDWKEDGPTNEDYKKMEENGLV